MSTKNLARTVIEGGRSEESKWHRRHAARLERVHTRELCRAVTVDHEMWFDAVIPNRKEQIEWSTVEHSDKTRPCDRFLTSRAGSRWNDVRSEICRRFDRRKLAGAHVTNDHLLNRVVIDIDTYASVYPWCERSGMPKFYVDARGFFRHNPKERY